MMRRFVFVIGEERMMGLKTFVTLFHPRDGGREHAPVEISVCGR